jgi:hypothetical protein
VTYGTSSDPFLATRCLKKLADDNEQQYPRAAHVLKNNFYVDDLLSGTSTIEDAINIQKELSSLLQTAGHIKKVGLKPFHIPGCHSKRIARNSTT